MPLLVFFLCVGCAQQTLDVRLCLQYNDVPGSDEEMELGLGSDASLASSCGKGSSTSLYLAQTLHLQVLHLRLLHYPSHIYQGQGGWACIVCA